MFVFSWVPSGFSIYRHTPVTSFVTPMQTHTHAILSGCVFFPHAALREEKKKDVECSGRMRKKERMTMTMVVVMMADCTQHTRNVTPHWSVIVIL